MPSDHYDLQWLWITVGLLSVIFVIFVMYYGLFPAQVPTRQMLPGITVICMEAQCNYMDLGSLFMRMWKELQPLGDMKNSRSVGFYFDNPSLIKHQHMARSAIGLVLENEEQFKAAREFVKRSHRYRIMGFPEVPCLSIRVPYRNLITYFLLPIFWGRMKFNEGPANYSSGYEDVGVEMYDYRKGRTKTITLNAPLHRRELFAFSSFPKPEYKRQH